jgi:hypothetical protein
MTSTVTRIPNTIARLYDSITRVSLTVHAFNCVTFNRGYACVS